MRGDEMGRFGDEMGRFGDEMGHFLLTAEVIAPQRFEAIFSKFF